MKNKKIPALKFVNKTTFSVKELKVMTNLKLRVGGTNCFKVPLKRTQLKPDF